MLFPEIEPVLTSTDSDAFKALQRSVFGKFPDGLKHSRVLIEDLLKFSDKIHPTAVSTAFMAIVGTITARQIYTATGCSTSMYIVGMAPSTGGKDIALKAPQKIFDQIGDSSINVYSGLLYSLGALEDQFKSHGVVTLLIDEFGDRFAKFKSALVLDTFKDIYSKTDGVFEPGARSSGGGTRKTVKWRKERPCLSICGVTTKTQFLKRIGDDQIYDGLLNRFIIMDGTGIDSIKRRDSKRSIDSNIIDRMAMLLLALLNNRQSNRNEYLTIDMDNAASDYYYNFIGEEDDAESDIGKYCNQSDFERRASVSGRWRENAIRLATAVTAYEMEIQEDQITSVSTVTKEVLEWAYELIKRNSLVFLDTFDKESQQSEWAILRDKAIKWFKAKHEEDADRWYPKSELTRSSNPFKRSTPSDRENLYRDLIEIGAINTKNGGTTGNAEFYQYNPEYQG